MTCSINLAGAYAESDLKKVWPARLMFDSEIFSCSCKFESQYYILQSDGITITKTTQPAENPDLGNWYLDKPSQITC